MCGPQYLPRESLHGVAQLVQGGNVNTDIHQEMDRSNNYRNHPHQPNKRFLYVYSQNDLLTQERHIFALIEWVCR